MAAKTKPSIAPRKPGANRSIDPVAAQRFVAGCAAGATDPTDPAPCRREAATDAVEGVDVTQTFSASSMNSSTETHCSRLTDVEHLEVQTPDIPPTQTGAPRGSNQSHCTPAQLFPAAVHRQARRTLTRARDGRRVRQLTAYLPEDLAKRLAFYCAEHDADKSAVIAEAVARFLSLA